MHLQLANKNLQRLNTLAGQRFHEKMATQSEADSKQLKVMLAKTKAMSEYARVLIQEADEHTKKHPKELRILL